MAVELVKQSILGEVEGEWRLHRSIEDVEVAAPASMQHLIEHQIGPLSSEEREVLEAGDAFSAATITLGGDLAVLHCLRRLRCTGDGDDVLVAPSTGGAGNGKVCVESHV